MDRIKPCVWKLAGAAMLLAAAILVYAASTRQNVHLPVDQHRLNHAATEPQNWMTTGGTYEEQRFSRLASINEGNAAKLGLAWSFEFDTNRGQEATPLVIDGVMYISTAWSKVYALDAATGRELWQFDPKVPGGSAVYGCCDVVNRGVAAWKGRIYVGTLDGRLIAIEAGTGKPVWSVRTTDPAKPYTITGAPRIFKDKVVIGNGGAEFGVRGYVTAYDAGTGRQVWRFYTVPPVPSAGIDHSASDSVMPMVAKTWFGTGWHVTGGGGTVWDSIVYDQDLNLLYIGVGNGSPWNREIRSDGKGDNLFLGSIVALDPDTGAYRWHYQETPGESFDFTSTAQITLATLQINGVSRRVILHAPKNGMFYVIDRQTGKLLSAKNFAQVTWNDGIDLKTGRPIYTKNAFYKSGREMFLPSSLGAHNWHPMSYSPETGLVYIPTQQVPVSYAQDPNFRFLPGRQNFGLQYGPAGPGAPKIGAALIAWDPLAQREVWRVRQPEVWPGGALSTAGNLVFAGNAHGEFSAFRATDGAKLWSFRQQAGIMAGPIAYSVKGVEYIAVAAGYGGAAVMLADFERPAQLQPMGRMLVFRLGGTAKLANVDLTPPPLNPPSESFPREQVAIGKTIYERQCLVCHDGKSVLPDLRRSAALSDRETWQQIVIDGALDSRGMVSFKRWISSADAEAVRAYVGAEAQSLMQASGAVHHVSEPSGKTH